MPWTRQLHALERVALVVRGPLRPSRPSREIGAWPARHRTPAHARARHCRRPAPGNWPAIQHTAPMPPGPEQPTRTPRRSRAGPARGLQRPTDSGAAPIAPRTRLPAPPVRLRPPAHRPAGCVPDGVADGATAVPHHRARRPGSPAAILLRSTSPTTTTASRPVHPPAQPQRAGSGLAGRHPPTRPTPSRPGHRRSPTRACRAAPGQQERTAFWATSESMRGRPSRRARHSTPADADPHRRVRRSACFPRASASHRPECRC